MGGGERGDYRLEEKVLFDDLEGTTKQFWYSKDVYDTPYLDAAKLYGGGKATVSGVIDVIVATSDSFVATHETGARNYGMTLIYTEETESLLVLPSPKYLGNVCMGQGCSGIHFPCGKSVKEAKNPCTCQQK